MYKHLLFLFLTVLSMSCRDEVVKEQIDFTPKVFNNIHPQDKSTIYKSTITMNWAASDAKGDPLVYTLQYWIKGDHTNKKSFKTSETEYKLENLLSKTDYQWQVIALNDEKQLSREGDVWDLNVGYIPNPQITKVDKDTVRLTEVLTIYGKDLELVDPKVLPTVSLNAIPTQVLLRTDDSIKIIIPEQVDNPLRVKFSDRSLVFKQTLQYYAYTLDKTKNTTRVVSADDTVTFYGKFFDAYDTKPTITLDNKTISPLYIRNDSIAFITKPEHGEKLDISLLGFDKFVMDINLTPFRFLEVKPKTFGPGDIITLKGKYFGVGDKPSVHMGDTKADIVSVSDTEIKIKVPEKGSLPIKITKGDKTASLNTGLNLLSFEIDSVKPRIINAGDEAIIHGKYFGTDMADVRAVFGDQQARILKLTEKTIKVQVLTGSFNPLYLTVRGETKSYNNFTIVTDFNLTGSDPVAVVGNPFRIEGDGFGNNLSGVDVLFYKNNFSSIRFVNKDRIDLIVPNVDWDAVGKPFEVEIGAYKKQYDRFQLIPFNFSEVKPAHSRVGDTTIRVGEQMLINGVGFGTDASLVKVDFNGTAITADKTIATQITTDIPLANPSHPLKLTINVNGTPLSLNLKETVRFIPFNFTDFSPKTLKTNEELTLKGLKLDINKAKTKVLINKQEITTFTSISGKQIKFFVPSAIQNGTLSVIINKDTITHPDPLRVIDYLVTGSAPVAQVLSPFYVTGIGFSGGKNVVVKFGQMIIPEKDYSIVSDTRIEFSTLPPGLRKPFSFSKNGNTPQTYNGFTVHPFKITGIDKTAVQSLEELTISGEIFGTSPPPKVTMGGVSAKVTNHSQNNITIQVPIGANLPIVVESEGKTDTYNPTLDITPYVITDFSPTTVKVDNNVTLNGDGFGTKGSDGSYPGSVTINGKTVPSANIVSWSQKQIVVKVPLNFRKGDVSVALGSKSLTYPDKLDIIPFDITGSDPRAFIRTDFKITGKNFGTDKSAITAVFGTVPATIKEVKDNSITLTVPGAPTKPLKITKEGYTLEWNTFTIVNSRVSGVDKNTLHIDENLTISGEGFGTDPTKIEVFFGSNKARLVTMNNTQLVVKMGLTSLPELPLKVKVRGHDIIHNPDLVFAHFRVLDNLLPYVTGDEVVINATGFFGSKADYSFKIGNNLINPSDITTFGEKEIRFKLKNHQFGKFIALKNYTTPRTATVSDTTNLLDITPIKLIEDGSKDTVYVNDEIHLKGQGLKAPVGLYQNFKYYKATKYKTVSEQILPSDFAMLQDKELKFNLRLGEVIEEFYILLSYQVDGISTTKRVSLSSLKYHVPFQITRLETKPLPDTLRTHGDTLLLDIKGVQKNDISFKLFNSDNPTGIVLPNTTYGDITASAKRPTLEGQALDAKTSPTSTFRINERFWGGFKGDIYLGVDGIYMPLKKARPTLVVQDFIFDYIQQDNNPITIPSTPLLINQQNKKQLIYPDITTSLFFAKPKNFDLSKLKLDINGTAITGVSQSSTSLVEPSRIEYVLIEFKTKPKSEGTLYVTYDGARAPYNHPLSIIPFDIIRHTPYPVIEYLGPLTIYGKGFGEFPKSKFTITMGETPKVTIDPSNFTIKSKVPFGSSSEVFDHLIITQVPPDASMPIKISIDIHPDYTDLLEDPNNLVSFKFQETRVEKQRDFLTDMKSVNSGALSSYDFEKTFCYPSPVASKIALTTICGGTYTERIKEMTIESDGTLMANIPESIRDLAYIEKLTVQDKSEIPYDFPNGLGELTTLKELRLRSVKTLPSLAKLKNLKLLLIDNDHNAGKSLSFDLNLMTQLETLIMSDFYPQGNQEIDINSLKTVDLEGVSVPMKFGKSININRLRLANYNADLTVSGLDKLINLVQLNLSGKTELPDLTSLIALQNMTLEDLQQTASQSLDIASKAVNIVVDKSEIYTLQGLDNNSNLKSLKLKNITQLSAIQTISSLGKLLDLDIVNIPTLTSFPDITASSVPKLKSLDMVNLAVTSLPTNIQHMTALEELNLDNLPALTSLPSTFGQLSNLQNLKINNTKITQITAPMVASLNNTVEIFVTNNTQLTTVDKDISNNATLDKLRLNNNKLRSNHNDGSKNVFELSANSATSNVSVVVLNSNEIQHLGTGICNMKKLERLAIEDNNLQTLPGCMDQLINLNSLEVFTGNPSVQAVPKFSKTFCNRVFSGLSTKPANLCTK